MTNPTVYTSFSPGKKTFRIARMALHKMDRNPECHMEPFTKPTIQFPFRIVYSRHTEPNLWWISCRGLQDKRSYSFDDLPMTYYRAINWLLEGEDNER